MQAHGFQPTVVRKRSLLASCGCAHVLIQGCLATQTKKRGIKHVDNNLSNGLSFWQWLQVIPQWQSEMMHQEHDNKLQRRLKMGKRITCKGESPEYGFTPVTEHPMIRPWRRTPRYHFGPILFNWTSLNPAFVNHWIYSSSFGKSIHTSAKKRDNQNVGYTGPIMHAFPPSFRTLYASLMPRCGSGQYSILSREIKKQDQNSELP